MTVPTPSSVTIPPSEVLTVTTKRVMCDGGGGALGHPKVWYDLGQSGEAECLYCDRKFVYQPGDGHDDGH
jgi:uncharacterized Zn-finger protein